MNYHPEKVRHTKLKPYVREIRRKHQMGMGSRKLAREYNVSRISIENVCNYVSYPHD